MRFLALTIIGLCLAALAAEDAYHRRLLLPPCDAYASSTGKLTLFNGGDSPVRLAHIRYSCECLSGKPPKKPLQPGESVEMEFTLSPNGKGGQIRQRAWLEFDWDRKAASKAQKTIAAPAGALLLTNQVQVEVQVLLLSRLRLGLNTSLLEFKDDDTSLSHGIQLTGSATEAVIKEVQRPETSRFTFELSKDKRSMVVTAVLESTSPKHQVLETWTLITSDEQVPQLSLTLNLHVKHDFVVMPNVIQLNDIGSFPQKGCLLIKPTNPRQPVKVLQATWENAEGQVELVELPHGLTRIAYSLEKLPDSSKKALLRLHTNSARQETVFIHVIQ